MAFPLSSAFFLIPIYKYSTGKTRKSMFFSHFWVSRLLFPLPYPLPRHCLGIVTAFYSSIPTTSPLSGYHACFLLFHTHHLALIWVPQLLFPPPYPLPRHCLGIMPTFPLSYPLPRHCLGITPAFPLSYPLPLHCLGIATAFYSPIPTTVVLSKSTQETKRAPAKSWG